MAAEGQSNTSEKDIMERKGGVENESSYRYRQGKFDEESRVELRLF